MTRTAKPTDFRVSVEGVGEFTFGKRTMRDECDAQVEYARIIQGVEPTQWLQIVGAALSDLRTLTVTAPEGWDLEELDPQDADTYKKLYDVHMALLEKERSFRRKNAPVVEAGGPVAVSDG
jgi:hypothetical protein